MNTAFQNPASLDQTKGNVAVCVSGIQKAHVACVVDLDNLLHRGFDKRSGTARPQGQLDILGLSAALRQRGVGSGTICRNRDFSALAERLWNRLGFKVVAARQNCDDEVITEAECYAEAGLAQLILVSGDGDYTGTVKNLRAQGLYVEVWARRANVSVELTRAANSVRYIDRFLTAQAAVSQVRSAA